MKAGSLLCKGICKFITNEVLPVNEASLDVPELHVGLDFLDATQVSPVTPCHYQLENVIPQVAVGPLSRTTLGSLNKTIHNRFAVRNHGDVPGHVFQGNESLKHCIQLRPWDCLQGPRKLPKDGLH